MCASWKMNYSSLETARNPGSKLLLIVDSDYVRACMHISLGTSLEKYNTLLLYRHMFYTCNTQDVLVLQILGLVVRKMAAPSSIG